MDKYVDFADSLLLIDEMNRLTLSRLDEPFFRPVRLPSLRHTCAEAGFLRAVSWLYALYREAGDVNLQYALEKLEAFNLDTVPAYSRHVEVIHALRTFLQHSLDLTVSRNVRLSELSEDWLFHASGSEALDEEIDWERCLEAVSQETFDFLSVILRCVQVICNDEYSDLLLREWRLKLERHHAPHEFDRIISITANDLGIDHVDPSKLRKQHYAKWTKHLETLSKGYNFEREARRLVEHVLLVDRPLPLTGEDVMAALGISPGPELGKAMIRAREIYSQNFCSKEELLAQMSLEY